MKIHRIILALMLTILAWKITCELLVEMAFFQFILIEILIAIFQIISTFVMNKAEGKPTIFENDNHPIE